VCHTRRNRRKKINLAKSRIADPSLENSGEGFFIFSASRKQAFKFAEFWARRCGVIVARPEEPDPARLLKVNQEKFNATYSQPRRGKKAAANHAKHASNGGCVRGMIVRAIALFL
jgi:hypothetical protein